MNQSDEPTQQCSNCEKFIPESKFDLHEAYCFRNIKRCPKCNVPVDKAEMNDHEAAIHKLVNCKYCKKPHENSTLKNHEVGCTSRPINCKYCQCDVNPEEFAHHEDLCGSRTKKCPFCNSNVIYKEYDDHEVMCQIAQETEEQLPQQNLKKFKNEESEGNKSNKNPGQSRPNTSSIKRILEQNKFKRTQTNVSDEESPTRPNNFRNYNNSNNKKADQTNPEEGKKKRLVKKAELIDKKEKPKKSSRKDSEEYYDDEEDIESDYDYHPADIEEDELEEIDDDGVEIKNSAGSRYALRKKNNPKPNKYAEAPVAPPGRSDFAPEDYAGEDAELQRVLMESLYQHQGQNDKKENKPGKPTNTNPIQIDDDEEDDEEFRRAIEASLENTKDSDRKNRSKSQEEFFSDHHTKKAAQKKK